MKKFNNFDDAFDYYNNRRNNGKNGIIFEIAMREYIFDKIKGERKKVDGVHALGRSDISYNKKAIECKTRCGWIVNPIYTDRESAENALQHIYTLCNFNYIIYEPAPYFENAEEARKSLGEVYIYNKRDFINILLEAGLLRVKKSSAGLYGISIQSYENSRKKLNLYFNLLYNSGRGQTVNSFLRREGYIQ